MKTKAYTTILAVMALMLFGAVGALAQTEHQHDAQKPSPSTGMHGKKPMQHDMSKMDMPGMMNEPHHALAMAYHQNLATFANALHEQTAGASSVNVEFARAAVAGMRGSFDQMKEHHQENMQTMNAEMHTKMSGMMQQMLTHQTEVNIELTALEQEVQLSTPDAKKVSTLAASVNSHLDAMLKMHQGSKTNMKMCTSKACCAAGKMKVKM